MTTIEDFNDFVNSNSTLLKILLGIVIVAWLISPVYKSKPLWNIHYNKIECKYWADTCTLTQYAYKHDICWDSLITSRRSSGYYRRHTFVDFDGKCTLQKYQTSVKTLFPLAEITDVIVRAEQGKFVVVMKDKKNSEMAIATFEKGADANAVSSGLLYVIKNWQNESQDNNELESTGTYDFHSL